MLPTNYSGTLWWYSNMMRNDGIHLFRTTGRSMSFTWNIVEFSIRFGKLDKQSSSHRWIHSETTQMKGNLMVITLSQKVHYLICCKHNQDAVYWLKLSRAQDQGLQFWQTKTFAIIAYGTVPGDCIYRVISRSGDSSIVREARNTKASTQGYVKEQLAYGAAAAAYSQGRRK